MSQLGFGVMVNMLCGKDRGFEKFQAVIGKTIHEAKIEDDRLVLSFTDRTSITLRDDGQSCCAHRYMTCDDDLPYYKGAELLDAEVAPGPDAEDEWGGSHEQEFLRVKTSKGTFTVANHNVHNGYYGGFYLIVE